MMAITMVYHAKSNGQSSVIFLAFDLQLATIVIFTFAIMLAIYNQDCWYHHKS